MKGFVSGSSRVPLSARIATALAAARDGDRKARDRLLISCEPLLRARVRRHLSARRFAAEGDDLLQTIRLSIIENLPALRACDPGSFLSWLEKLVRCRILDWERGRGGRSSMADGAAEGGADRAAPTPTPSRILMDEETRARIAGAIERVPARYREVLRLIARKDPGPEEVAAFLGKGPDAARKFVERALAHLGQALRAAEGTGTRRLRTRFPGG
jgi:RNA polymerase sigma factor (sigma-70 family)